MLCDVGNCAVVRSFFLSRLLGAQGHREEHSMRSTLLVSTAVLLAGIGLASAQNTQSGGQSGAAPSAQSQGGAAGQERQSPQSSPSQRGAQSQQGQKEPMQKDTTGQAQQRDQAAPSKAEQKGVRDQQSPTQAQSPQRQQNRAGPERAVDAGPGPGLQDTDHRTANDDQKHRSDATVRVPPTSTSTSASAPSCRPACAWSRCRSR